jgi:hypothetical protein
MVRVGMMEFGWTGVLLVYEAAGLTLAEEGATRLGYKGGGKT